MRTNMYGRKMLDYCHNVKKNGNKCLREIYNEKTIKFSKGFFDGNVYCYDCQQELKEQNG